MKTGEGMGAATTCTRNGTHNHAPGAGNESRHERALNR